MLGNYRNDSSELNYSNGTKKRLLFSVTNNGLQSETTCDRKETQHLLSKNYFG